MECDCCSSKIDRKIQGVLRWVLLGLTVLAWIFSVVTVGSCTFFDGAGLFKYERYDGDCEKYDLPSGEAHGVRAGRAFGTLACLSLSFAMIGILLVQLVLKNNVASIVWLVTRVLYAWSLLCVLLTFSVVADCDDCELGAAGVITALNVFLIIGIVTLSWLSGAPDDPVFNGIGKGPQRYPKIQEAVETPAVASRVPAGDATANSGVMTTRTVEQTSEGRRITEEVIHPDGTRTVTITTERDEPADAEDVMDKAPVQEQILHDEMAEPEMDLRSVEREIHIRQPKPTAADERFGAEPTEISSNDPEMGYEEPSYKQPTVGSGRDPSVLADEPKRNTKAQQRSRGADPPGEETYAPSLIVSEPYAPDDE